MSEKTAAFALDTLLATEHPDEDLGFEMCGLVEAIGFDYERWCRIVRLDPDEELTEELYDITRNNWCKIALSFGTDVEAEKALGPYRDKWVGILHER